MESVSYLPTSFIQLKNMHMSCAECIRADKEIHVYIKELTCWYALL